jgi:hypothetical protein
MQEEEEEEEEGGGGERRYGYCLRTRGSCTRAPGTPAVVIINCISSSSRPLFAQRLYLIPRRVLMATCHRAADSYRVPPSSFPTGVTLGYPRWGEEGGGRVIARIARPARSFGRAAFADTRWIRGPVCVHAHTAARRRSLAVIAHTSTTQLLAARCGIIYPII